MTKSEFETLIDHLATRFQNVAALFAVDAERPPGDNSTSQLAAWWEVFCTVELSAALGVVRDIYAGNIERPYYADKFPALINQEIRRRRNKSQSSTSVVAQSDIQAAADCAKDRERFDRLDRLFGPSFDRLSRTERSEIAIKVLPDFWFKRWRLNPFEFVPRYAILEYLETSKLIKNHSSIHQEAFSLTVVSKSA